MEISKVLINDILLESIFYFGDGAWINVFAINSGIFTFPDITRGLAAGTKNHCDFRNRSGV